MKADIHPVYKNTTVSCACGAAYETCTTRNSYAVDVCSACHPFFTGKARIMDKEGRVERFKSKYKSKGVAKDPAVKA